MSIPARILDRCLTWYQVATEGRISPCRYVPSCSTYAREAIAHHGAVRGTGYAAWRLCRCHPWGGHGFDPVPGTDEWHALRRDEPSPDRRHLTSPARRTS